MRPSKTPDEPRPSTGPAVMKDRKSVLRSFNFAWEGLTFCFSTQRHMRVHFAIMALVLLAAWGLRVNQDELLQLLTAMVLVLIAEMVNTAVEYAIDLSTDGYDPRAKVAKDVAAGAVLLAAIYSVTVAVLVFTTNPRLAEIVRRIPVQRDWPVVSVVQLVVIGLLLLSILITYVKKATRRGTLWRGGMISGHTAFGFLIATAIGIVTHDLAVTALALALALLVSQSRIQARIHSPTEVLIGGVLGIIVAFVLFMWPVR
ncbi:MAG: diacylglycerol kinase [Armatimonadetes bacterium]|nr:diacylglycerol kinase [Armatimonadota bacterium]